MARPLWSGSLSFGLVNVPVALLSAVRDLDLHFHQLHASDGAPVEVRRYCSAEDREVPYEEIARSLECDDGGQVIVTDAELEALEPRRTRTIDIERFVDLGEVEPIFFDHPYFLVPAGAEDGTLRAYRLLAEVMAQSERAALGRFVMRAREHLAIVRAREGVLSLTTMVFAEEVRPREGIDTATEPKYEPTKAQHDAAVAVIEELTCDWEPEKYTDCYRERLERVVDRKRRGETIKAPAGEDPPAAAPDLMEALERTLADLGASASDGEQRSRQPQETR